MKLSYQDYQVIMAVLSEGWGALTDPISYQNGEEEIVITREMLDEAIGALKEIGIY
jgi:hypothetical protein